MALSATLWLPMLEPACILYLHTASCSGNICTCQEAMYVCTLLTLGKMERVASVRHPSMHTCTLDCMARDSATAEEAWLVLKHWMQRRLHGLKSVLERLASLMTAETGVKQCVAVAANSLVSPRITIEIKKGE